MIWFCVSAFTTGSYLTGSKAGPQKQRGCLEHVVTLRLLTNIAQKKKIKLFVTFIDFSKAYNFVPRHKMFEVLKQAE